jgi:hypothetical protein
MEDEKWERVPMCEQTAECAERVRNILFQLLAAGFSELEPRLFAVTKRD